MKYKFEIQNNKYCLLFSDGLVLEKEIRNQSEINYNSKSPVIICQFKRPDDRWTYFVLYSNGTIEEDKVNKCKCLLPREHKGMSPVDYEMYILLFNNWVKKNKLTYSKENRNNLKEIVKQFDTKNSWLDDLIYHKFVCNQCSDELIISINTYRGGGGLKRNEKLIANKINDFSE